MLLRVKSHSIIEVCMYVIMVLVIIGIVTLQRGASAGTMLMKVGMGVVLALWIITRFRGVEVEEVVNQCYLSVHGELAAELAADGRAAP